MTLLQRDWLHAKERALEQEANRHSVQPKCTIYLWWHVESGTKSNGGCVTIVYTLFSNLAWQRSTKPVCCAFRSSPSLTTPGRSPVGSSFIYSTQTRLRERSDTNMPLLERVVHHELHQPSTESNFSVLCDCVIILSCWQTTNFSQNEIQIG